MIYGGNEVVDTKSSSNLITIKFFNLILYNIIISNNHVPILLKNLLDSNFK